MVLLIILKKIKHFYTSEYWLLLKINNKYPLDTALETATYIYIFLFRYFYTAQLLQYISVLHHKMYLLLMLQYSAVQSSAVQCSAVKSSPKMAKIGKNWWKLRKRVKTDKTGENAWKWVGGGRPQRDIGKKYIQW